MGAKISAKVVHQESGIKTIVNKEMIANSLKKQKK